MNEVLHSKEEVEKLLLLNELERQRDHAESELDKAVETADLTRMAKLAMEISKYDVQIQALSPNASIDMQEAADKILADELTKKLHRKKDS